MIYYVHVLELSSSKLLLKGTVIGKTLNHSPICINLLGICVVNFPVFPSVSLRIDSTRNAKNHHDSSMKLAAVTLCKGDFGKMICFIQQGDMSLVVKGVYIYIMYI